MPAMATTKRERQRANREVRRAEEEKTAKRTQLMSRARKGALWGVAIVAVLALAQVVF